MDSLKKTSTTDPEALFPKARIQNLTSASSVLNASRGRCLDFRGPDRIQIAAGLRKNHDLSRKKFFAIAIPDWNMNQEENEAELAEEAKQMALAAAAAGVKPGAGHHK